MKPKPAPVVKKPSKWSQFVAGVGKALGEWKFGGGGN